MVTTPTVAYQQTNFLFGDLGTNYLPDFNTIIIVLISPKAPVVTGTLLGILSVPRSSLERIYDRTVCCDHD